MMNKDDFIEQVGWMTQMPTIPPLTEADKDQFRRFFRNYVTFLQDNQFTTRDIIKENELVTDEHGIRLGDLTEEGLAFYKFGIMKWISKYDRAKDKEKAINDFKFIEKKLIAFKKLGL